jgi:hypothetical protein
VDSTGDVSHLPAGQQFQYSLTSPQYFWRSSPWVSQGLLVYNDVTILSGSVAISVGTSYTTGGFTYTRGTYQTSLTNGSSNVPGVGFISLTNDLYSVSRT